MEATMTEEQEKLFDKYERICEKLLEHNIELTNITGMGPELTNMTTGKKMIHNSMTWQTFPEEKIVEWVVDTLKAKTA